jgi:hypothetical protein
MLSELSNYLRNFLTSFLLHVVQAAINVIFETLNSRKIISKHMYADEMFISIKNIFVFYT